MENCKFALCFLFAVFFGLSIGIGIGIGLRFGLYLAYNVTSSWIMDYLENCKFAIWILVALIIALLIGFGIRYGLFLVSSSVDDSGIQVIVIIAILVGLVLLGLSIYNCVKDYCYRPYAHIALCLHNICPCTEQKRKDDSYLFGYA